MNQFPIGAVTRIRYDAKAKFPPLLPGSAPAAIDAGLGRKVAEGLQLTRASTIALTRLQLALAGGDRRQAMAAIDRLHVLDGEIEHLVERLPSSADNAETPGDEAAPDRGVPADGAEPGDDLLASLGKHLNDQKLALAFEKLALASGISGPDLISAAHPLPAKDDGRPEPRAGFAQPTDPAATDDRWAAASDGEPPHIDWHAFPNVQPVVWDRIPPKILGIFLTVLIAAALIAAVVTMTMV